MYSGISDGTPNSSESPFLTLAVSVIPSGIGPFSATLSGRRLVRTVAFPAFLPLFSTTPRAVKVSPGSPVLGGLEMLVTANFGSLAASAPAAKPSDTARVAIPKPTVLPAPTFIRRAPLFGPRFRAPSRADLRFITQR